MGRRPVASVPRRVPGTASLVIGPVHPGRARSGRVTKVRQPCDSGRGRPVVEAWNVHAVSRTSGLGKLTWRLLVPSYWGSCDLDCCRSWGVGNSWFSRVFAKITGVLRHPRTRYKVAKVR